jgi:chromosome condensin MukBEF ATPase and DNA-binding subunit MukB
MTSIEREIGNLEARMETVEQELQAIRSDVREIRDALVGAKGGWRTLTIVIAVATSCGALLGRMLPNLIGLRP